MKTTSMMLALVSSLSLAAARPARAQEARRGTVEVRDGAARAVVAGPVAIHVYSAFSGASVFLVAAVSGTDRDCAGARLGLTIGLVADRVQTVDVAAGQVACVATAASNGSELLWHAQRDRVVAASVVVASTR